MSNERPTTERDGSDNAVRHAGLVLIGIGVAASLMSWHWNSRMDFPKESDLVSLRGTLERIEVETFTSRTSDTKWVVLDVNIGTPSAPDSQRWVLPDYSTRFDERLEFLKLDQPITGKLQIQEQMIRGSDQAIRVLWSIEQNGEVILPYDLVLAVEQEIYHHSPAIGVTVLTLGVILVLLTRGFVGREEANS